MVYVLYDSFEKRFIPDICGEKVKDIEHIFLKRMWTEAHSWRNNGRYEFRKVPANWLNKPKETGVIGVQL